jgi:hypothetical protein
MKARSAPVTDWFRLITQLCHQHGYTHLLIAMAVGAGKSTVQGWKQGSEPGHRDGESLITLWCEVTGEGRDQVPTIGSFDWRR